MKKIAFLILLLGSLTLSKAQNDKLIGNWEYTSGGQTERLQIVSQNELIYNSEPSAYIVIKSAIRVFDEYGGFFDYLYVLQNDQLLLTFPDGYQYPFQKVKDTPQANQATTKASNSTQALYGSLCSFSSSSGGGSSYSSTEMFFFDGKGRYSYSTNSSYRGSNGQYMGNDPNAITGRYQVVGKALTMYLDRGGIQTMEIYFVQNSGEITELRSGQLYFGKSICE